MRWLTGVAARALRGRGRAGDDGCPCLPCRQAAGDEAAARDPWRRSLSESALAAFYRASAERDAMREERDRWRGEAYVAASRASRLCRDRGYAQAEADIAAWLRASAASPSAKTYEAAEIVEARAHLRHVVRQDAAAGVERGDHRKSDRSERCAGCGTGTADERGRYVLRTTNGYCDSCLHDVRNDVSSRGSRARDDAGRVTRTAYASQVIRHSYDFSKGAGPMSQLNHLKGLVEEHGDDVWIADVTRPGGIDELNLEVFVGSKDKVGQHADGDFLEPAKKHMESLEHAAKREHERGEWGRRRSPRVLPAEPEISQEEVRPSPDRYYRADSRDAWDSSTML